MLVSEVRFRGIPPEARDYRFGNRSGINWVLDQHEEKTPKGPTIRARFNTAMRAAHRDPD